MAKKIFISYTREDQETVRELHSDLVAIGNDVFFDQQLTGGQSWWSALLEQSRQSDIFMPVVGSTWIHSIPCQLETEYAQALGKRFLPVVLADVPAKLLPASIAETQWIRYEPEKKDSVLSLLKAVDGLPDSDPLPDPLPEEPPVPISYLTELRERVQVKHDIARTDQVLLVAEIRRRLEKGTDDRELGIVLETFRARDDLNVHVANQIDDMLAAIRGTSSSTASAAEPPPPPPPQPQPQREPVARPAPSAPSYGEAQSFSAASVAGAPAAGQTAAANDTKIVVAYVCAAIAVFLLPIIFGPVAIWLAHSEKKVGNPKAGTAFAVAIGATILGMIVGMLVFAGSF